MPTSSRVCRPYRRVADMEPQCSSLVSRLVSLFVEQLSDGSGPIDCRLVEMSSLTDDPSPNEMGSPQELKEACQTVEDVWKERMEDIRSNEQKYLLALFVAARLDQLRESGKIAHLDTCGLAMRERLRDVTHLLDQSRYRNFRDLLSSTSQAVQNTMYRYVKKAVVEFALEINSRDFQPAPGEFEEKVHYTLAAELARQFFGYARLYFTVSVFLQDSTHNSALNWEPLISQLKWTGPRDAFIKEFRSFLSQEQGVIPLSGGIFVEIALDIVNRRETACYHNYVHDLMHNIRDFYVNNLLSKEHLLQIAEEFWLRYGSRVASKEVFHDVDQVWVPLLAFFVTHFWDDKRVAKYIEGIVKKLFQKPSSFQDIAKLFHKVVDTMKYLVWAKEETRRHKESLKAFSKAVFSASRLNRPSASVSSEDILACYKSLTESHQFCQFTLLQCFQLPPDCLQLTFGTKIVQLTSTPHNRRICKRFALLLDEAKGWGLTYELNDCLQSIFDLLHRKLKDNSSPSRNATVFKFISYSKKYLQCIPALESISFTFWSPSEEPNIEEYVLQEVPEAMRAFRHCSDIVARTPNCLPVKAWTSYCKFAAGLLESWASIPGHLSPEFIPKILSVLTVDYELSNFITATVYQELFKALRNGCGGKTVNIPSSAQLLSVMQSIHQMETQEPSVHELSWMEEFDQLLSSVREEVDDLNEIITKDRFNFGRLQALLYRKNDINELLRVFGLPQPQWKQLSDFDTIRQNLRMLGSLLRILLMHPFQRNKVQDVVHDLDKVLVVSDATFEELSQLDNRAESLLGPLYYECLDYNESLDSKMNARSYLEYFEKEKKCLFEGFCQALVPLKVTEVDDSGETWYKTICAWLKDVHCMIKKLLDGSIKLFEIPQSQKFRDVLCDRSRLEHEMTILGSHPYYQSAKESTVRLCESLRMTRLIVSIPELIETLDMMEVVDEKDEDFAFLIDIGKQTIRYLTLEEILCKEPYQRLARLFSDLPGECIDVMKEAGKYTAVVKFFRDHDFHSESGSTDFLHIKENMTMRVRGDAFKSDLLNAVIVCKECVEPLRSTRSTLKHVIETAKGCTYEWREATKFLQLVNENMVQVQRMFSKEMTSAHEDATEQACYLARLGVLELSLQASVERRQRCKLMYKIPSQQLSESVSLQGEEIETFNLLLAFESNRPQTNDNQLVLSSVVAMLHEVLQIADIAQRLVDLSHPKKRESKPITIEFTSQQVSALRLDLQYELKQWNNTVELVQKKCDILKVLSQDEVAHMMDLLMGSKEIDPSKPETAAAQVRRFMSYIYSITSMITSETEQHLQDAAVVALHEILRGETSADNLTEEMQRRLLSVIGALTEMKIPVQDNKGTFFSCRFARERVCSANVLLFLVKALSSSHKLLSHYQLLWCSPLTSSAELQSFCSRITACSGVSFAFVGVDCLSLEIRQELELYQQQLRRHPHGDVYFLSVDVGPGQLHPYDLKVHEDVTVNLTQVRHSWKALKSELGVQTPTVTAVSGAAGSGKTHFILNQLETIGWANVRLTINEAVDTSKMVQQLSTLPDEAVVFIAISAEVDPSFVNKFMFCLFVCGTLQQDDKSHSLFALPKQSRWQVFIEVPFETEWKLSCDDVLVKRFPMVYFVADDIKRIDKNTAYHVSSAELRLAECVDMLSHWSSRTAAKVSGLLMKDLPDAGDLLVKMNSDSKQLSEKDARVILKYLADKELPSVSGHAITNRTVISFFFKLLSKRFAVFSDKVLIESVRYPTYRRFPEMLYKQFVKEAAFLCTPHLSCLFEKCKPLLNFSSDSGHVSFYPFYKGHMLPVEIGDIAGDADKQLRTKSETERLEAHLGWMLGVPSRDVSAILNRRRFVLTEDYCYKMILIHQRKCARVPLIIEGETGVGKTFLLETYAELLNWQAHQGRDQANSLMLTRQVSNWLRLEVIPELPRTLNLPYEMGQDLYIEKFDEKGLVEEVWILIAEKLNNSSQNQSDQDLYDKVVQSMIDYIRRCYEYYPILKPISPSMAQLLNHDKRLNVEESSRLLRLFLSSPRHSLFFKLLVHPGLQPLQIFDFLSDAVELAQKLSDWTVVVFFDEVNTASCPGVFKEITVDHAMRGQILPDNLFIVAAINPYRKAPSTEIRETAFPSVPRTDYNVMKLPDVMDSLLWKYGEFNINYAKIYIRRKIQLEKDLLAAKKPEQEAGKKEETTKLISSGLQEKFTEMLHTAIRFCYERLGKNTVSQRDVERVFALLPFMYHYGLAETTRNDPNKEKRFHEALCLTIALAFVWRLPVEKTAGHVSRDEIYGSDYFNDPSIAHIVQGHVDAFVTPQHFHLPEGIALTRALKENVFAVVAAVQTGVPLAIVGAPGLSKTLSLQIARNNLKGPKVSPREFCRQFSALDSFYHHCSEFSEASHIELTFHKAIKRQEWYDSMQDTGCTRCVVLLDDSGLPNEKKMVLKCLHPFLDEPRVSFVAASNRPFDAANANRMITVYRSRLTDEDHYRLAVGCLGLEKVALSPDSKALLRSICRGLSEILDSEVDNRKPFHYRDFIHVFRCLHRHSCLTQQPTGPHLTIDPRLLLRSLEENLNGLTASDFDNLVTKFFTAIVPGLTDKRWMSLRAPYPYRNTVTILEEVEAERQKNKDKLWTGHLLAPRFTMIIDATDDLSSLQLLFHYGLLNRSSCRVFRISDLSEDRTEAQTVKTLNALCYALEEETTAVFVNCKRLEGSLYELLNQSFRGCRHLSPNEAAYANIVVGASVYPCKVNARFHCVVVMTEQEALKTPAPFLSRFAKFRLSPSDFLHWRLRSLPSHVAASVNSWTSYARAFVDYYREESLVGLNRTATIDLTVLAGLNWNSLFMSSEQMARLRVGSYESQRAIQTRVRDDSEWSKVAVVSRLLQLATPESIVLNFSQTEPSFRRLMASLYFDSSRHCDISFVISQLLRDRSRVQGDRETSIDLLSTRKFLLYSRSNKSLCNVSQNIAELFGQENISRLSVASDLKSRNAIAQFLETFLCDDSKMIAVIVVDVLSAIDVRLLCQLIDDADHLALGNSSSSSSKFIGDYCVRNTLPLSSNRSFILILHFPGEQIFSPGVISARFMNGWDTFFVQQTDAVSQRILRGIATICAQTAEDVSTEKSSSNYTVAMTNVICDDSVWSYLLQDSILWFCSRIRMMNESSVNLMYNRLVAVVRDFYTQLNRSNGIGTMTSCLRLVLTSHPVIEEIIQQQVVKNCNVSAMSHLIITSARQVFSKRSFFSLADLLVGHVKQFTREVFSTVFICLSEDFGLSTLMQVSLADQSLSVSPDILRFLLTVGVQRQLDQQCQPLELLLHAHTIVYRTPLFSYIRHQVQEALGNENSDMGAETDLSLAQNYQIIAQLAAMIGDSYLEDVVTLVCTDGVMVEGCESSVRIVTEWLQLEFNDELEDKITFIETAVQRHREEMMMIYKAAMSVQTLGKEDILLSSVLETKTRSSLVDSLHRKICEIFMVFWMGHSDDIGSLQSWLVSVQNYFRSRSAQSLRGNDLSWLTMYYTLTTACVLVVFTLSAESSSVSRLLGLIRQQTTSTTCLRSVISSLGVIVSSDIFDDCDRSAVYIQTLRQLAVSIPRSAAARVLKDVKELLHVFNGEGIPSKVQLKQLHYNDLFVTLVQHIDMDNVSWRSLLEEVLEESCSTVCRGCHRGTAYFPMGYPERDRSSECLKKPIADSYFAYHLKAIQVSSASNESVRKVLFERTTSTSASLMESIESAAVQYRCILDAVRTLKSVDDNEDIVGGNAKYDTLQHLVFFCWGRNETLVDSISGSQLSFSDSHASSFDSLTGNQLLFLDYALSSVGTAKIIGLLNASSHDLLNRALAPALDRQAFGEVPDCYNPTVDDDLIIKESLEVFPKVRLMWKEMQWPSVYIPNTYYFKLREQCSKYLEESPDFVVQRQCRQTLKMLVLLQTSRIVCDGKHTQPPSVKDVLDKTDILQWSEGERRVLKFLVSPAQHLETLGLQQSSPVFRSLSYLRGSSDLEKHIRITCLNHLLLTVGLGEAESYFWSLMFHPSQLVERYVFGGTTISADKVISRDIKLDLCHQYDERGQPLRINKFLSLQSVRIITAMTFASLLWYVILHDAEETVGECFSVLTEDEVMKMEGQTTKERLVSFCWDKMYQSLCALYQTYGHSSSKVVLSIQHVMSRYAAHHRQCNKTSPLCNSYKTKSSRNSAEKYFLKHVFLPVWKKTEEITRSLPEDGGIMKQLKAFRLKQATVVTHQEFNNALVNAVPALPDESPLRTLMENYVMLTLTDKFMPLCRLYLLVHTRAATMANSLDDLLQTVVASYAKCQSGRAEESQLRILSEGIDAFNCIVAATHGELSANPELSNDTFSRIDAKTSLRYVCSLPEPSAPDALYRAMSRLSTAHATVLDSFRAYRSYCEDEKIKRLLSLCDLDEAREAEIELASFNGDGLITLERNEFDTLLSTCQTDTEQEFLSFDFSKVERLVIQQFIMQARRIDIQRCRTKLVLQSPLDSEQRPSRSPSPKLPDFLTVQPLSKQFQKSLNDKQRRHLGREIAEKTLDECVELLENLSVLASAVSVSTSCENINAMSLAQFAGKHNLKISCLQRCPRMAATTLEYLKSVHTLLSKHLVDCRYFYAHLRSLPREPLPQSEANDVSTALDRLSSKSPDTMLQHCECFTKLVQECFPDIQLKVESSLVDVLLSSCQTSYRREFSENLVMTCIPPTVLVKHISDILTFVVRTDASTRQKLIDARERVMWGFKSKHTPAISDDHMWKDLCLPQGDTTTLSNRVFSHGPEMWKSCEYRRASLFSFNAEVVRVCDNVFPMQSVVVLDSSTSRKPRKYDIRDGKSQGDGKFTVRHRLCQSDGEKLTNKSYLVLKDDEQPLPDSSTNVVTMLKFSRATTRVVCIHVYGDHVIRGQSSRLNARVETTRDGCVFNAEFAAVATVADVLSVVLTFCCDASHWALVTGVIHLRDGKVLDNDKRLEQLSSHQLQHMCCNTSAKRLFKCTRFSTSRLTCSVIPSRMRDFICHVLQDVPHLRDAQDIDIHSFYLWPPLDDEALCNTIREVCVIPRESIRSVHVSPDSNTTEPICRLPALLTTTMKTAASYASETSGIPFDAQIVTSSSVLYPIADYVSVGYAAERYGHQRQSEPHICLTKLPREWRVVVSKSSRDFSVSVPNSCVVTRLLDQILKVTEMEEKHGRVSVADCREQMLLIDSRSMCVLPRLLHLPFCYVSNATFESRSLTLREKSNAETLTLDVETLCLDDETDSRCRTSRSYQLCLPRQQTNSLPISTIDDLVDFLSWLPEYVDAFSSLHPPVLRLASCPVWLKGDVELEDYVRKVASLHRKCIPFQLGYSNGLDVRQISPLTLTFVHADNMGTKLSGTIVDTSITVVQLRRFAEKFFGLDEQTIVALDTHNEPMSLQDNWTWNEVVSRFRAHDDGHGTADVTLRLVQRSEEESTDDSASLQSFEVVKTSLTVRVKDSTRTCEIALTDSCNVGNIIQLSLTELALSEKVDSSKCVLCIGIFEVEDRNWTLNDIVGEDWEHIELELKLPPLL